LYFSTIQRTRAVTALHGGSIRGGIGIGWDSHRLKSLLNIGTRDKASLFHVPLKLSVFSAEKLET